MEARLGRIIAFGGLLSAIGLVSTGDGQSPSAPSVDETNSNGKVASGSSRTEAPSPNLDQTQPPPCFSPGAEVFSDLPPELSHYKILKPGQVIESPFALPRAPRPSDPLPVNRFKEETECLVFTWTGKPGGAGGTETRIWDVNGFQWKRIRVNSLQGDVTNYDSKGPIRRR